MSATTTRPRLSPASLSTLVCMACTAAWLLLALVVPLPGMIALLVGVSWALLCYLHLALGPVALLLAFREHRPGANAWIYGYFLLFAVANLAGIGIQQRWDLAAERQWERLTRDEDVALRRMAGSQQPPDVVAARQLLAAGANADTRDEQTGGTPLMWAVRNGHQELATMLIAHGADVNAEDRWGDTALAIATRGGPSLDQQWNDRAVHGPIVDALLDAGANADASNLRGETPVLGACLTGVSSVFERLHEAGVRLDTLDGEGRSCLMLAVRGGKQEVARRLVALGQDVNHRDGNGASPLAIAVANDDAGMVRLLLAAGADASVLQGSRRSAVRRAIEDGNAAALAALKEGGAVAAALEGGGSKDLLAIARRGEPRQLAVLLDLGVDPNVRGDAGRTPLHFLAACTGCSQAPEKAALLIESGADVNLRDERGVTALASTTQRDGAEVARVLIAAGADINELDADGDSLLLRAALKGRQRLTALLRDAGARVEQAHPDGHYFVGAIGDATVVAGLISIGLDPNVAHEGGDLPLVRAAVGGKGEVVRALIEGGADPNAVDKRGKTVLWNAVERGRLAAVDALIAGGVDVTLQPPKASLPLYEAVSKQKVAIAIALLRAGAKSNPMLRRRADSTLFGGTFKGRDADRLEELKALLDRAPGP